MKEVLKEKATIDFEETSTMINKLKTSNIKNYLFYWMKADNCFSKISEVYPFTNENIKEYCELINLQNKKILTVTSSADQAIISILHDAMKIDTFDSNQLTYYHLFFKIAALKTLSYDDFLKLYTFNKGNHNILNYYKKLRDYIEKEDVKLFWDLFLSWDNTAFSYFFLGNYCNPHDKIKQIDFLNEETFYITKEKIHNDISFKNIDANLLPNEFTEQYDFINLSNIMNYAKDKDSFSKMIKFLIDNLLTEDGVILSNYNWSLIDEDNDCFVALKNNMCNPYIQPLEKTEDKHSLTLCKK